MVKVNNTVSRLRQTTERLHVTSVRVDAGIQNIPNRPSGAWRHDLGTRCNKDKKRFDGRSCKLGFDFDPFSHLEFSAALL